MLETPLKCKQKHGLFLAEVADHHGFYFLCASAGGLRNCVHLDDAESTEALKEPLFLSRYQRALSGSTENGHKQSVAHVFPSWSVTEQKNLRQKCFGDTIIEEQLSSAVFPKRKNLNE